MGETVYVIQTTLSGELNEAEVGFWAQSIIDSKLAACVNVKKVQSIFRWEGNIESIAEWQIQIKTSQFSKETLISKIKEENFYENPEIYVGQQNLQKNILIGLRVSEFCLN